ncbi:MAG TPA: hypothetical protein VKT80_17495, partial [Chloroflexota bacterium]|nr:hypothetical protein [Chloroflexota bacterium]
GASADPTFQPNGFPNDFRLTLTTGVPVTTSDVTAATTIYLTPITGNRFTTFDASGNPTILSSAEISIAVPATTNTMYDVWAFNNGGTLTLELLAWSSDTARATGLTTSNGRLVKGGDSTRMYVGSIRTTGVSGQTEDSAVKRYVWNYYNRRPRKLSRQETAGSSTMADGVGINFRQMNSNTSNQVETVLGVDEELVALWMNCPTTSDTATNTNLSANQIGIGLDSTTVATLTQTIVNITPGGSAAQQTQNGGGFGGAIDTGIGRHQITMLEKAGNGNGTTSFFYGGTYPGAATMSGFIRG